MALSTTAVLLFGCATPQQDPSNEPALKPPPRWTADMEEFAAVAQGGWVSDFSDDRLSEIVGEALEQNLNLSAAAAQLDSAWAIARIEGAGRWPEASGGQNNRRQQRAGTGGFAITNTRSNNFNLSLDLSWEIDLWGKLRHRYRAAKADWEAAKEDYRGARFSLAAQTAQAWFNAIEAEMQVELSEQTLRSYEANLRTIDQRFRAGITRALDLRLIRANVARARSDLASQLRQRDVAVRSLETLLGRYPAYEIGLSTRLPVIRRSVPAGLPSELVSRRPDILAAHERLFATQHRVSEAKRALLPSIRLTASGGTSTDEFDQLLNRDFKVWSLANGVFQPIFQGSRLAANVERWRAQYTRAWAEYSQQVLTAFREVETALAAETYLATQEAALETAVDESVGAEDLAWDQYGKGLANIITVLESQRHSFDSKRQFLRISNQRLQNRVDLYLALGGDFGDIEAERANSSWGKSSGRGNNSVVGEKGEKDTPNAD